MPSWCAICRQHTSISHFDNRSMHKAGIQFGWVGRLMAIEMAVERVADWYTSTPGETIRPLEHLMEVYNNDGSTRTNDGQSYRHR